MFCLYPMHMLCAFDRFVQSTDHAALLVDRAALLTDCPIAHQLVDRATCGLIIRSVGHCKRTFMLAKWHCVTKLLRGMMTD